MKSDMQEKELYERPRMEIILLEAKNPVLTSCPSGNEPSDICSNGDSNEEPGCFSYNCAYTPDPGPGHDPGPGPDPEPDPEPDPGPGCLGCDQAFDIGLG